MTIITIISNIHIHMLDKRTNILFEEQLFNHLVNLASEKNTSVGNLVRQAVVRVYFYKGNKKRVDAVSEILRLRKKVPPIKNSEIKDFIEYGRKN